MSQVTAHGGDPARPVDGARTRLLDAAVEAFASKGFHGTTTRDIASAAGMSPAALYVHHRSKEELLYQISRSGHEETLRLAEEALASSADPVAQLRAMVRGLTAHQARNHTTARIVNYELAALSPAHLAEILDIRHAIEARMRELVEAGVAAGVFRSPNPRMTALALLSLGVDTARWYRDQGSWTPEQVGEYYGELALAMVGADEA